MNAETEKNFAATCSESTLLTPQDIARPNTVHANTVKRIADELGMEIIRTPNGCRLFTLAQAQRIGDEIKRRRQEAMRR